MGLKFIPTSIFSTYDCGIKSDQNGIEIASRQVDVDSALLQDKIRPKWD